MPGHHINDTGEMPREGEMPPESNNQQDPGQEDPQDNQTPEQGGETSQTWEQVLATLPEEQRQLHDTHTQGLRSALQSERQQRQELTRQLREATQQLEEGSQARQQLEALTNQLETAERRADFMEEAVRPEIGCTNPRLAYMAAQEIEAIDRRGRINWDALKQQFPELFKSQQKTPPGNAGSGTGQAPTGKDMNAFIRTAAGRPA